MSAKFSNSTASTTTITSTATNDDDTATNHRTPADVISHLRNVQGTAIYYSVLNELRDMASGGDGGESGSDLSIREQYYPNFSDHDFADVLRGLHESTHE